MVSRSSKYAIKAVLYLAVHSNEAQKVMVKDIAKPINVPQAYIAKLLQELSKQKIISSTRGAHGGFYLSKTDREQSVMSIIDAIDGKEKFNSCMLSLKECDDSKPCPMHNLVYPLKEKLVQNLRKKTIEDLSDDVKSGIAFLPL